MHLWNRQVSFWVNIVQSIMKILCYVRMKIEIRSIVWKKEEGWRGVHKNCKCTDGIELQNIANRGWETESESCLPTGSRRCQKAVGKNGKIIGNVWKGIIKNFTCAGNQKVSLEKCSRNCESWLISTHQGHLINAFSISLWDISVWACKALDLLLTHLSLVLLVENSEEDTRLTRGTRTNSWKKEADLEGCPTMIEEYEDTNLDIPFTRCTSVLYSINCIQLSVQTNFFRSIFGRGAEWLQGVVKLAEWGGRGHVALLTGLYFCNAEISFDNLARAESRQIVQRSKKVGPLIANLHLHNSLFLQQQHSTLSSFINEGVIWIWSISARHSITP